MALPRTKEPHICSARSNNYEADPDVLPTLVEQRVFDIKVIPVPVKHEDMWDGATPAQKTAMLQALEQCLARR